jgi:large subunit ribosomal protein L13
MIIDGSNAVLGRLANQVAKKALLGEQIKIVNCDKIVISGNRDTIFAKYDRVRKMGTPRKGPFIIAIPSRFVKRVIRGMLPYKQEKGRLAFNRIRCYDGIPDEFKDSELTKIAQSTLRTNTVHVADVCKHIGGK